MNDFTKLNEIPYKWGIHKGSVLLITSDITELGEFCISHKEPLDFNSLIDSIIDVVGPSGTVLFPTYNWGFCRGETFDYNKTLGQTGSLGRLALRRKDFKRTKHPIYSFAVWGKDQDYLCGLQNESSFGKNSPFGYLNENHAINVIINVPTRYTFVHYVEQKYENELEVTYRFHKSFQSLYKDENGKVDMRSYSMFVRYRDADEGPSREEEFVQLLKKHQAISFLDINGFDYKIIDMAASVPAVIEFIKANPLYGKHFFVK